MTWVRSLLFFVSFVLGIVVYAVAIVLVWPLVALERRQALASGWSRFNVRLLALTCGLTHRVEGVERLPPPPYVILAKHQSAWETITWFAIFSPFAYVLKKGLMYIPFFGWALRATDQIFIDRGHNVESMRKLQEEGGKRLGQGRSLLIFPEGTRVAPGQVGDYKGGGVVMAMAAGVPIVPVAHNAGVFWARRSFLKHPGVIQVRIGPPIATAGLPKTARKALLQQVQESIEGMMAELPSSLPE